MKNNKQNNFRKFNKPVVQTMKCSCGSTAKMKSSKIYPFGTKSKGRVVKFFRCSQCGRRIN